METLETTLLKNTSPYIKEIVFEKDEKKLVILLLKRPERSEISKKITFNEVNSIKRKKYEFEENYRDSIIGIIEKDGKTIITTETEEIIFNHGSYKIEEK